MAAYALSPLRLLDSFGQQAALASHEGLAQTQSGTVRETALLHAGM